MSENILHNYATYTYSLALAIISPGQFNGLPSPCMEGNVIAASAGRYPKGRDGAFAGTDFFFEDTKIETIIACNAQTKMSNVVKMEFKIVEPMGMTFFNRLITAAMARGTTYLECPYLMEVCFFGYPGQSTSPTKIPSTKYIAVKIVKCDLQVSAKGAEYTITAVPYNYSSMTQTIGTIPYNYNIQGETVDDIFKPADSHLRNSFTKAMNDYYSLMVEKEHATMTESIEFDIPGEIKSSKIVESAEMPITMISIDKDYTGNQPPAQSMVKTFPANKGTSIVNFLSLVIRNSDYIKKQALDFDEKTGPHGKSGGVIKWFKVAPNTVLTVTDPAQGRISRKTIYKVILYDMYNTVHPTMPVAAGAPISKEYNYIFTGKNKDILDFNIQLNSLFYQSLAAFPKGARPTTPWNKLVDTHEKDHNMNSQPAIISMIQENLGTIGLPKMVEQFTTRVTSNINNKRERVIEDFTKTIMEGPGADLVQLDLKIVGDPDFIKQDDIYHKAGDGAGDSVPMNTSEVFVKVSFKSPVDYNQGSGMADAGSASEFNGTYRVISVENIFSGGKFEQVLKLVRVFLPK